VNEPSIPIRCSDLGVAFTRGSRRTMLRASLRRAFRALRGTAAGAQLPPDPSTHWALRHVSFTLRTGASLAVCGDNGAGKTTLLRTIAGIYQPDEGSLRVRGRTSVLLSLGATLDPRLSGEQNVLIAAALYGIGSAQKREHLAAVQAFSELDDATLQMPVRYYSAGMRLRLAFATASVLEPELLLIDEMLGVGDAGFRHKSVARLHELTAAARCVIICSHVVRFLRDHCEQALWLHQGRLMACGPANEVLDEYQAHTALMEGRRTPAASFGPLPPPETQGAPAARAAAGVPVPRAQVGAAAPRADRTPGGVAEATERG